MVLSFFFTRIITQAKETAVYEILVRKGDECWLVFLTQPDNDLSLLGFRKTKEEAVKLASDIRTNFFPRIHVED